MKSDNLEEFVKKSNAIHFGYYDYSEVCYINNRTKVKIICPLHGSFYQVPKRHKLGKGCKKCRIKNWANAKKMSTNDFIERATSIHNHRYIYDKTVYNGYRMWLTINCPKHGDFQIRANYHLGGYGCQRCGIEKRNTALTMTVAEFVERANKVHNRGYGYEDVVCISHGRKVSINCKKHGTFQQGPSQHLSGQGCPTCKSSCGENLIRNYLLENNISFQGQYKSQECRDILPLPFDFAIWVNNIIKIIEYHGRQHYHVANFSSDRKANEINFNKTILHDQIKKQWCDDNGIPLLIIPYTKKKEVETLLKEWI